jgi:hypothetical protein
MLKMLAAALALAPPAAAQPAPASFRFGGVEFQMPIPAGYCLPTGSQIEFERFLAAGDERNATHLSLSPCASEKALDMDFIVLKTPNAALWVPLERAQFLEELGAVFDSEEFKSQMASGEMLDETGKAATKMFGTRVDVAGGIRPLGKDERCGYMGGTLKVASPEGNASLAVGTCMTVVSGRMLVISWYGPDTGSRGIAELLLKSKRLAGEISGKPAS